MSTNETSSRDEVFDQFWDETGTSEESAIRSPVKQWMVLSCIVIGGALLSTYFGSVLHGEKLNILYIILMFFLWNNVVFCAMEIVCLYVGRDYLKQQFAHIDGGLKGKGLEMLIASFNAPVNHSNIFSRRGWSKMFVAWGVLDRDYATQNSYGYLGEAGNGLFSVIPTCVILVSMVFPVMPAIVLGIVSVAFFYQTIWASSVYVLGLWKFADNSENSLAGNAVLYGGNFIWIILPIFGIYTSVRLIFDNSFQVFFS